MILQKLEQERTYKQKYLLQEIVNENFDVLIFECFLKAKKENGDDIDQWDFLELKRAVVQFKSEFKHSLDYDKLSQKMQTTYSYSLCKQILFY